MPAPNSVLATDASGSVRGYPGSRLLVTVTANMNVTTKTTLLKVARNYNLFVTMLGLHDASDELDTASFGFGYNANADDVDASSVHDTLVDDTVYDLIIPLRGAKVGTPGDTFGVKCSVAQGSAATLVIDVFGYYMKA